MRKLFRVPTILVLVLLTLALVAGGASAAYTFFDFSVGVSVDEPLTIEYNLQGNYGGDDAWHPLGDEDSMTLERSAGDNFYMDLRITNIADNALTVNTVLSGDIIYFTDSGFPNGDAGNVPGLGAQTVFNVSLDVHGDAPAPHVYTINFAFDRS